MLVELGRCLVEEVDGELFVLRIEERLGLILGG
jgi:hypothetical protein